MLFWSKKLPISTAHIEWAFPTWGGNGWRMALFVDVLSCPGALGRCPRISCIFPPSELTFSLFCAFKASYTKINLPPSLPLCLGGLWGVAGWKFMGRVPLDLAHYVWILNKTQHFSGHFSLPVSHKHSIQLSVHYYPGNPCLAYLPLALFFFFLNHFITAFPLEYNKEGQRRRSDKHHLSHAPQG